MLEIAERFASVQAVGREKSGENLDSVVHINATALISKGIQLLKGYRRPQIARTSR
jgi:hypothetical protein